MQSNGVNLHNSIELPQTVLYVLLEFVDLLALSLIPTFNFIVCKKLHLLGQTTCSSYSNSGL